ncbi:MAG: hypothetical protein ACI9MC_000733 [Kiritimatiellia bacterium]|jgi:hypothetical protein
MPCVGSTVALKGNNTHGAGTVWVDADVDRGDGTISPPSRVVQGVVIAGNPKLLVAFE